MEPFKQTLIKIFTKKSTPGIPRHEYDQMLERFNIVLDNFKNTQELIEKLSLSNPSKKEHSTLIVLYSFIIIEGFFVYFINFLIYFLILQEHHDIWDPIKQKFVSNFEDIADLNLSQKLKFLKHHKIYDFSEVIRRDLRNCIAHQNYSIQEDGSIQLFKKGKKWEIVTQEELTKINKDVDLLKKGIVEALVSILKETYGKDRALEIIENLFES